MCGTLDRSTFAAGGRSTSKHSAATLGPTLPGQNTDRTKKAKSGHTSADVDLRNNMHVVTPICPDPLVRRGLSHRMLSEFLTRICVPDATGWRGKAGAWHRPSLGTRVGLRYFYFANGSKR